MEGNGASCVGIKVRTDTTKLADMVIARFGDGRYLVREAKMFIKDESKVASRVSGVKSRHVMPCSASTVRASEKSSIITNRKSYTGFPTSHQPRFYGSTPPLTSSKWGSTS